MSVVAYIKITKFMKKIIFDQFACNSFWNFQGNSLLFLILRKVIREERVCSVFLAVITSGWKYV